MCDHDSNETRRLAYAVLDFLDEERRKPTTTMDRRESLEVATQCLETAFGITLQDTCLKPAKSLRQVYQASSTAGPTPNGPFNTAQSFAPSSGTQAPPAASAAAPASAPEIQPIEIQLGAKYTPPPPVSAEVRTRADAFKDDGNALMKNGSFSEALKVYTEAIELDGSNAVYFCNRSASYIKLNDLERALRDVQIAIQLDPTYARAYGRMGVVQSNLGNHLEGYSCYKKAHELDPANPSYENNLRVSTEILSSHGQGDSLPPQFSGLGSNDFAALFQNPALMNMATQMLRDPGMQNMMRNIMGSFQPNGNLHGAGGGAGAGAGFTIPGGNTNTSLEQIMQMGRAIAQQLNTPYSEDSTRRPGDGNDQDTPQNDSYDL